jgi:hypothetical protein
MQAFQVHAYACTVLKCYMHVVEMHVYACICMHDFQVHAFVSRILKHMHVSQMHAQTCTVSVP